MLDLSFLTEEEQEAIMKVLQRDANLKKAEDERVRTLEVTVEDANELKNKSGQWFYEAKSKRHRDKIHGADLIRASIRKKKPQTLAELSQSRNGNTKKSWVNNVNKDFFIPPELVGVVEEPEKENEEEKTRAQLYRSAPRVDSLALSENDNSMVMAVSSPSKQRKNPFNDPSLENNFELPIENHISQNGAPHETPENDILVPSQKSQDVKTMPTVEFNDVYDRSTVAGVEVPIQKPVPKPKARTVTYKISDLQSDNDGSLTKPTKRNDYMNGTGARRGILKRSPSSSSTDSEIPRVTLDTQSKPVAPVSPILEGEIEKNHHGDQKEDSFENSLDRLKQVRFTSVESQSPDTPNGREVGEFDLLESDYAQHGTNDIGFKHKDQDDRPIPVQSTLDSHVPSTVSVGENSDASLNVTLPSVSSNLDNLKLFDAPKAEVELVPSRKATSVQSLPEDSELLQERATSAEDTSTRRPNGISVNILENGTPTFRNALSKESVNLSDSELQTSKLMTDQQPIYAKIKSPRVSKLDSVGITQGNSSDASEPSCKTETVLEDPNLPKYDDPRDHSNISHHVHQFQSNANVPVSEELKVSKTIRDQQPPHAEIKSPQVSELESTDHQQAGSEEDSNLVVTILRRSANKAGASKSLEDISSAASMPEKVDVPKEESVRNAENDQKAEQRSAHYETISDRSTLPAYPDNKFQDPEKLKRLSKSVPDFLHDESDDRETDSTSEGSFPLGRHKKTPSSLTNISGSSGMASLSSVSGSVMSIYSGDFGNLDVKGNIQFAIDYVEQLQEFHIFVAQCKELAVAEEKKQRSDPYVKSYLLPGKEKMGKRKTAVRKKTLNPAYNEILRYKISKEVLLTQKLNLSVWHNDTFGRNSFLGEVDIDLATWDWSNKHMNWYALQPRTPPGGIGLENRGEMSIALKYATTQPSGKKTASSGEVHIWVKSCSNLPILRGNRINSFVKCTVLPDTSRKSRQKTRTVDKTTNPVFNHTMVYDGFRAEDLREACVELTVWDHNRLANHFLGGLRLGLGSGKSYGTPVDWMDSTAYESSLWKKMINMPNEWVEETLQLRMLMMAKMSK